MAKSVQTMVAKAEKKIAAQADDDAILLERLNKLAVQIIPAGLELDWLDLDIDQDGEKVLQGHWYPEEDIEVVLDLTLHENPQRLKLVLLLGYPDNVSVEIDAFEVEYTDGQVTRIYNRYNDDKRLDWNSENNTIWENFILELLKHYDEYRNAVTVAQAWKPVNIHRVEWTKADDYGTRPVRCAYALEDRARAGLWQVWSIEENQWIGQKITRVERIVPVTLETPWTSESLRALGQTNVRETQYSQRKYATQSSAFLAGILKRNRLKSKNASYSD